MAVNAAELNNYMGYTTQRKEPSQEMDKDAFMKLLVAQLQNQDPTEQQDPSVMVQQMTSFSQLEQLQNLGTLIQGLMEQNVALFQAQSTGLVGKTARIQGAPITLKETQGVDDDGNAITTKKATVGLDLAGPANVTMIVKDERGMPLGTVDLGQFNAGHHDIEWDGKTDMGMMDTDTPYYISFQATNVDGETVTATSVSDLKIDSVAFADGSVLIVAGGKYYSLGEIIEVRS